MIARGNLNIYGCDFSLLMLISLANKRIWLFANDIQVKYTCIFLVDLVFSSQQLECWAPSLQSSLSDCSLNTIASY